MKLRTFVLFFFLLFSATAWATHDRLEVVFTSDMTRADLDRIQKDLAQKGIVLEYASLRFDATGHLQGIRFYVVFANGLMGSASCQRLPADQRFGFSHNAGCSSIPLLTGFF